MLKNIFYFRYRVNTSSFSKQLPTIVLFQDGKETLRRPAISAKGTVIKFPFTKVWFLLLLFNTLWPTYSLVLRLIEINMLFLLLVCCLYVICLGHIKVLSGSLAQWVKCLTGNRSLMSSSPIKGSHCFLVQKTTFITGYWNRFKCASITDDSSVHQLLTI